jgi:ribose transport system substrate-binding protein
MGVVEALEGANRTAKVVGINGTKEAVDAIKAEKLLASGDYNGLLQGCIGTTIATRALRKQPAVSEIILKPSGGSSVQT